MVAIGFVAYQLARQAEASYADVGITHTSLDHG
jgi:hypothetical protein